MKSLTLSTDISFGYPNCCLRRLRFQDTPFIKQWRNSQMAILRQTKELTDEDQVNWFKQIQTDTGQSLFALTNQEDSLIGYAGLTNIDWVNHRAEISFLLLTGIHQATYRLVFLDALAALQVHAFEQLGLHKIFAETFEFRPGGIRFRTHRQARRPHLS